MDRSSLKFVIVGHVDHGKSTLIGRLLYDTGSLPYEKIEEAKRISKGLGRETEFAYLLDHLEEERRQGITIDTTQVFFKTDKREYVIIDAPGHVEFIKNMITGASQAEAAVLIIDVSEGIKEQTKRHAYILSLLGIAQVIVVLNKMDLVGFKESEFDQIRQLAGDFFDTLDIKPCFFIPICAISGENITDKSDKMDWYQGPTLLESLDTLKIREPNDNKPLLFPVQDIYKVEDKRILAGRIEAGVVRKTDKVKILPSNNSAGVDSIERYLEDNITSACAGQSIGLVLKEPVFIDRGYIICLEGSEPVLTDEFCANIFWMSKKDFNKDERLIIRCSTQETTCKITAISKRIDSSTLQVLQQDAPVLKNLEVAEAIIKTKSPVAIKKFNDVQEMGRFVLLRGQDICAGGIITTLGV